MPKETSSVDPMKAVYFILSVLLALFISYRYGDGFHGVDISFFARILIFLLATIFGYIGALIGNFVRNLAIPDVIYTDGRMSSVLKEKFFWFIVPQLIGIGVGGVLGAGMVGKLFGYQ